MNGRAGRGDLSARLAVVAALVGLSCSIEETGGAAWGGGAGIGGSLGGFAGAGGFPTGGLGNAGGAGGTAGTGAAGGTGGSAGSGGVQDASPDGDAAVDSSDASDATVPVLPTDFAGLALWLDASSNVFTSGGAVQGWLDQSPAKLLYAQTDPMQRPVLSLVDGGPPFIRFSGLSATPQFLAGDGFSAPASATVLVVAARATPTPADYFEVLVNGVPGSEFRLGFSGDASLGDVYLGAKGWIHKAKLVTLNAQPHLLVVEWNGGDPAQPSSYGASQDGTPLQVTATGLPPFPAQSSAVGAFTGGGNPFKGDLGEIIVYSAPLSPVQLADLSIALKAKWKLP